MSDTVDEIQALLDPEPRRAAGGRMLNNIPRIACVDGFSLSVQASSFNYCEPRDNYGPWDEVEVGFPSEREEKLMSFAESPEKPTDTVYVNVPIELVAEVIDDHGGIRGSTHSKHRRQRH